jgi:hypothetical protein
LSKESNGYGWVRLHRKIALTSFYKNVDATHLALHLILHANFADSKFTVRHNTLILRRGQYLGGYKRLANELGWGKMRVRRATKLLLDAKFMTQYYTNQYGILTLCNYNSYQSGVTPQTPLSVHSEPPEVTAQTPSSVQAGPHHNNVKKVKERLTIVGIKHFEELWSIYPKKIGKKTAFTHMRSSIKTVVAVDECRRAITNYKNSRDAQRGFIMHGKTFFNNWTDWVTDPDPGEDPQLKELKDLLEENK